MLVPYTRCTNVPPMLVVKARDSFPLVLGQLGVHDYKKEIQFFFFVSDPLFLTSPTSMLKKSKPREGSSISGF